MILKDYYSFYTVSDTQEESKERADIAEAQERGVRAVLR